MQKSPTQVADRRRSPRVEAPAGIRVTRAMPVMPLDDAEVLNVSAQGVAISTSVPMRPGDRLSFTVQDGSPPVLAEVLAVLPLDGQRYRVRCRCLLGAFDVTKD